MINTALNPDPTQSFVDSLASAIQSGAGQNVDPGAAAGSAGGNLLGAAQALSGMGTAPAAQASPVAPTITTPQLSDYEGHDPAIHPPIPQLQHAQDLVGQIDAHMTGAQTPTFAPYNFKNGLEADHLASMLNAHPGIQDGTIDFTKGLMHDPAPVVPDATKDAAETTDPNATTGTPQIIDSLTNAQNASSVAHSQPLPDAPKYASSKPPLIPTIIAALLSGLANMGKNNPGYGTAAMQGGLANFEHGVDSSNKQADANYQKEVDQQNRDIDAADKNLQVQQGIHNQALQESDKKTAAQAKLDAEKDAHKSNALNRLASGPMTATRYAVAKAELAQQGITLGADEDNTIKDSIALQEGRDAATKAETGIHSDLAEAARLADRPASYRLTFANSAVQKMKEVLAQMSDSDPAKAAYQARIDDITGRAIPELAKTTDLEKQLTQKLNLGSMKATQLAEQVREQVPKFQLQQANRQNLIDNRNAATQQAYQNYLQRGSEQDYQAATKMWDQTQGAQKQYLGGIKDQIDEVQKTIANAQKSNFGTGKASDSDIKTLANLQAEQDRVLHNITANSKPPARTTPTAPYAGPQQRPQTVTESYVRQQAAAARAAHYPEAQVQAGIAKLRATPTYKNDLGK